MQLDVGKGDEEPQGGGRKDHGKGTLVGKGW